MVKYSLRAWKKLSRSAFTRQYPPMLVPTEATLRAWASREWVEYQAWLFHHSFLTLQDWRKLREIVLDLKNQPLISIVTPVFNTPPNYLRECIYSVQTQIYPNWEICLVDDGSDDPDTIACLRALVKGDTRLRLQRHNKNQGICFATNQAIAMAHGDYVVFLDHDDRLAPEALYHIVMKLQEVSDVDVIYSDRDSLSPRGLRFMHLFKPQWSPETLLSGNYLFHMTVYRSSLLRELGGVRADFEGSQDYDLILRASDRPLNVQHIPKVLYHWRQHEQSIAMAHNVKEYVYSSGIRALEEAFARRGLTGKVSENNELWRGNYRVQLHHTSTQEPFNILPLRTLNDYAQQVNHAFVKQTKANYLIILGPGVNAEDKHALLELISWLQIDAVGMVTGKVISEQHQLLHVGLVQRTSGIPLALYFNFPENTTGYMAVAASVRNVSTPHPACCVIKRNVWQRLNGLNPCYSGPHAIFDFALRASDCGVRTVYNPHARFTAKGWELPDSWPVSDCSRFLFRWLERLKQGDPHYNPNLTLELVDMGLSITPPFFK